MTHIRIRECFKGFRSGSTCYVGGFSLVNKPTLARSNMRFNNRRSYDAKIKYYELGYVILFVKVRSAWYSCYYGSPEEMNKTWDINFKRSVLIEKIGCYIQ